MASQNRAKMAKIKKNCSKFDVHKKHAFQHHCLTIFHRFDLEKLTRNRQFFGHSSKTLIMPKSTKTIVKPMVFHSFSGFEPPKLNPKSMQNAFVKKHRKK